MDQPGVVYDGEFLAPSPKLLEAVAMWEAYRKETAGLPWEGECLSETGLREAGKAYRAMKERARERGIEDAVMLRARALVDKSRPW